MRKNYKLTMLSCFGSYLTQSTVINFLPLLFITFHDSFGIPLQQITLLITLVPNPVVNLIGCAVCGFAISLMWPGTLSIAPKALPLGGTAMYALLALAGDVGCSSGPTLVGFVSSLFGDNLKVGILAAMIFPILILLCLFKGNLGKETE